MITVPLKTALDNEENRSETFKNELLPSGGVPKDVLFKQSSADFDRDWESAEEFIGTYQAATRVDVNTNSRGELYIPWANNTSGPIILDIEVLIDTVSVAARNYVKKRFYLTAHTSKPSGELWTQHNYVADIFNASSDYDYIGVFVNDTSNNRIICSIYSSHNRDVSIRLSVWGTAAVAKQIFSATFTPNVDTDITVPPIQTRELLPDRLLSPNLIHVSDWNDITDNGWYDGSDAANAPPSGHSGKYVMVIRHKSNADWVSQQAYDFGGDKDQPRSWIRIKRNGEWGIWKEIVLDDDSRLSDARTPTTHGNAAHNPNFETELNADQKRKITYGTSDPSGGSNGDIYLQYED